MEHAGRVLEALLGSREHADYQKRLRRWAKQLLKDRVGKLIIQTRQECLASISTEKNRPNIFSILVSGFRG